MNDQDENVPRQTAENIRAQIKTAQLVRRLQDYALGKSEMEAAQVKVAELLLKKSLPDLPGGRSSAAKNGGAAVALTKIPRLTAEEAILLRNKLHDSC